MNERRTLSISGVIQTIIILIGLIVVAINSYNISNTADQIKVQSKANGDATNKTLTQLAQGQDAANQRGNLTLSKLADQSDQIVNAEHNIQTNLTRHRQVANATRDLLADYIANLNNTNEQGRTAAVNQIVNAIDGHIDKLFANRTR